jgi:hypothetical protein
VAFNSPIPNANLIRNLKPVRDGLFLVASAELVPDGVRLRIFGSSVTTELKSEFIRTTYGAPATRGAG